MKHAFYFRFYRIIPVEWLCCLLARLTYALWMTRFLFKKLKIRQKPASMSAEEARRLIDEVYPQPESSPLYVNPPVDDSLDLSVVIPVYNYADVLEKTILSILCQKTDYKYNVILVDDGSTDGASGILKKYADHEKVMVISQPNSGIGAARNTGINHASGKYLMFMDCDDIVREDIVEKLLRKAYETDADMTICAFDLVKEKNGEVTEVLPNIYPSANLIGYKNGDAVMNYPGLPWAKVYKRQLWDSVRFFPGYWYEDTIIHCLVFPQCGSYSYIKEALYDYKWYEKNFSHTQGHSKDYKVIDRYWLLREIICQHKKIGLPDDAVFYTLLLRHLSVSFYDSVKNLDDDKVEALFLLGKEIIEQYKPSVRVRLPFVLGQIEKAFKTGDLELWKLASASF